MNQDHALTVKLEHAIADYRATWQPVDTELYELCRRRPSHRDFTDVYTKVAIIGRVYHAGISRAWRGDGDPESQVAHGLAETASLITAGLDRLADRTFTRHTAAEIVELHGQIARAISTRSGDVWLASFISKYLHFHHPEVPIYDTKAQAAIGQYIDWRQVTPVRDMLASLPEWAHAYRNFTAAFAVLRERIDAVTPLTVSVKQTDHLLWQTP